MKLIDILVEELPKRGGWPQGSSRCMQTDGLYVTFPDIGDHCDFVAKCMAEGVRIATREQYEAALAASKPEWDGNGLPPVGCECEYETNGYGIKKVRVECITTDGIAFTWLGEDPKFRGLDCINTSQSHRFRPIRSEADKKRSECVIALSRIDPQAMPFEYGEKHSDGSLIGPFWYELYDAIAAGKIPHIRID